MRSAPADLLEVYTDRTGAETARDEWRTSARVARVRILRRSVRAAGSSSPVLVVCVWWTDTARALGWDK